MNVVLLNTFIGSVAVLFLSLISCLIKENLSIRAYLMLWRFCTLSFILPFFLIKIFLIYFQVVPNPIANETFLLSYTDRVISMEPGAIYPSTRLKIEYAILTFWILCVLGILIWHLLTYFRLKKYIRTYGKPINDVRVSRIIEETKKELGIRKPVDGYILPAAAAPFSMGILRPSLYLPENLMGDPALQPVIRHELQHIRNHDGIFGILVAVIHGFHFYNPFFYLCVARERFYQELYGDEFAKRDLDSEETMLYANAVINASTRQNVFDKRFSQSLGNNQKEIKRRLSYITSSKKIDPSRLLAIVTGVGLALLCGISSFAYQPPIVLSYPKNPDILNYGTSIYQGPLENSPFYTPEYEIRYDDQIIDASGNIYEYHPYDTTERDACDHTYVEGKRLIHIKTDSGGCEITAYQIRYCSKCEDITKSTRINVINYDVCTH